MTDRDRLALQYEPLVRKIARQFSGRTPVDDDDIIGYAREGLVIAMNKYKDGGTQSFKQYAAYQIRYNILNRINSEGQIVKFSVYNQKKAKSLGNATNLRVSLNINYDDDGNECIDYGKMSDLVEDCDSIIDNLDIDIKVNRIINSVRLKFSERDCDIFCKFNGIGTKKEKCTDIAHEHHISITSVSLINKRIMEYIKENSVGMED